MMLLSRRSVTGSLLMLGMMPRYGMTQPVAPPVRKVAAFRAGRVAGVEQGGIVSFKGIPFAAPPVGPLRFKPPLPAPVWTDIRDGAHFGPAPIQSPPRWPVPLDVYLGAMPGEDCLRLNIWAPAAPGHYPVYVYIHGGANQSGAASQPIFDGARFAAQGIICVTVGYRVGIPGFLELGGLLGPDYAESGNNGLRDIVAALHWVRDNIAAIGGDPDRVTLGGQSAGAKNVSAMIACPQARGLFGSAIMESGGDTHFTMDEARGVADLAQKALHQMGRRPADLLTMPASDLLKVQEQLIRDFPRMFAFRAIVGGDVLPVTALKAISAGAADHIRLLLGTNRDESIMFVNRAKADDPLQSQDMAHIDLATAQPLFEAYRKAFPALSPLALKVRFLSAEEYIQPTIKLALAHAARRRTKTYLYHFDRPASSGPFAGWAAHSLQSGYVWDALNLPGWQAMGGKPTPQDLLLAAEMHDRWVNFIAQKAPDAPHHTPWPLFTTGAKRLLTFMTKGEVGGLDPVEQKIW